MPRNILRHSPEPDPQPSSTTVSGLPDRLQASEENQLRRIRAQEARVRQNIKKQTASFRFQLPANPEGGIHDPIDVRMLYRIQPNEREPLSVQAARSLMEKAEAGESIVQQDLARVLARMKEELHAQVYQGAGLPFGEYAQHRAAHLVELPNVDSVQVVSGSYKVRTAPGVPLGEIQRGMAADARYNAHPVLRFGGFDPKGDHGLVPALDAVAREGRDGWRDVRTRAMVTWDNPWTGSRYHVFNPVEAAKRMADADGDLSQGVDMLVQMRDGSSIHRGVVVEMNLFCPFYEESQWALSPMNASNNVNGLGAVARTNVYT